jgi:hypothetical protein
VSIIKVTNIIIKHLKGNEHKILVGKRPLGRPRHKWEDTIKMGLREVGWKGVAWIHLVRDRDRRHSSEDHNPRLPRREKLISHFLQTYNLGDLSIDGRIII